VLIVDDEEGILSSLRRLLRREAYELITVANAKEALRVMEEQPVSLLISDYRMPGMSGTDLLLEVQRRWPETLRIVLSGYSEVKAIISAINEGAVYKFITKPWNDEEIKLHVRRALEQHALRAENQRMAREISLQNQRLRELNEQLDQRAADASRGLTFAQETLEMIDAGVVTIDVTGLVVTANREAVRLLAGRSGHCAGESAQRVLPETLWQAVSAEHLTASSGRVEIGGRRVQWRAGIIEAAGERRGVSLVLWEELAPTAPPP
jgi:response regulator RpfG family c-di-GMP phosphodiesterase